MARRYVDCPADLIRDGDRGVSVMLRALRHADMGLKHQIMMLLGSFAKEDAAPVFLDILMDDGEMPNTRHFAAFQLSTVIPHLEDESFYRERLLRCTLSHHPSTRTLAVTALGWPGNPGVFDTLAALLRDTSREVRMAAATSLCRLEDPRCVEPLLGMLEWGTFEEKRTVLFNIWRSGCDWDVQERIYFRFIRHRKSDLRLMALVLLKNAPPERQYTEILHDCLDDDDARIRRVALERLTSQGADALAPVRGRIRELLDDSHMEIKRSALMALQALGPEDDAPPIPD